MEQITGYIRYWKALLRGQRVFFSPTTVTVIEGTIACLERLKAIGEKGK